MVTRVVNGGEKEEARACHAPVQAADGNNPGSCKPVLAGLLVAFKCYSSGRNRLHFVVRSRACSKPCSVASPHSLADWEAATAASAAPSGQVGPAR